MVTETYQYHFSNPNSDNLYLAKSDAIKAKSEQENVKPIKNQLKRQTMNNPNLRLTVMKSDGNIKLQNIPGGTDNQDSGINSEEESNQHTDNEEQPQNSRVNETHNENNNNNDTVAEIEYSLENVSQEALYDANSENNLSEIDVLTEEQLRIYHDLLTPVVTNNNPIRIITSENESQRVIFPAWLLHLLQVSEEEDGDSLLENEPHFYSQGDGLGKKI